MKQFSKKGIVIVLGTLLLIINSSSVLAAPIIPQLFQITNDSPQQNGPQIYGNTVAYTNWGGSQDIDIWGYNLSSKTNFPIVQKPGMQFLDALYKNLVVYDDFNDATQTYSVHVYDMNANTDTLITPGSGTYNGDGTNGKDVIYTDGGVCGTLMDYNLRTKKTRQLVSAQVCNPKLSVRSIVWVCKTATGQAICRYNLDTKKVNYIADYVTPKDTPNIYKGAVVWQEYDGSQYRIMTSNLSGTKIKSLVTSSDYLNYLAYYKHTVVWCKSTGPSISGVDGLNIKTNQTFVIYPQGPQQNTNIIPLIWGNTVVWRSYRTGNGDIYGATL